MREATQASAVRGGDSPVGRRVGGRFWALACETDSEGEEGDAGDPAGSLAIASPTPSDTLCEALTVGYAEEVVADLVDAIIPSCDPAREGLRVEEKVEVLRRVVHRRTASAIRPWKGLSRRYVSPP